MTRETTTTEAIGIESVDNELLSKSDHVAAA